ncbi:MAG: UDP-2,3-diacylglucosamine diphosphatase [Pseudomonadota bacterium]
MNTRSIPEPDKTHYRTIFLSDIHLGTKGCQADRLASFLKQHSCDQLYLVGDIIDGWRMKSSGIYWPQSHVNVIRRVLTMTKRGTEVIYVTGNHDEFLRDHSPLEFGNLKVVDEAEHRSADGRTYWVVHGDQFDVVTRYHRWLAWLGDVGYTILLEVNRLMNRLRTRFGYGYWSLSAWLKHRVKQAVNYIGDYEDALARQCHKQGNDGVICGHIHHAEISNFDGVTYMNCGDWVESCTALVEDAQGRFKNIDRSQAEAQIPTVIPFEEERLSA